MAVAEKVKEKVEPPRVWEHTHTLGGVPVQMHITRGPDGRRVMGIFYFREDGGREYTTPGKKAIKVIIDEPTPEPLPPPPPVVVVTVPRQTRELLDVEVAAAVLRAAAWPLFQEAYGYAETSNGDSATVVGFAADGVKRVRVCQRGQWVTVLVPRMIGFEIVVEEQNG